MSLLYPGIDDEDSMRWYDNVHGLLGGGHPHKPFPPPQDKPTPPVLHPDDPLGDNNMWLNPFNPPVTNPLIEYGSEDIKLHGNMDDTNSLPAATDPITQKAPDHFVLDYNHPDGGYWKQGTESTWIRYPGGGYWSGGDIPDKAMEYYGSASPFDGYSDISDLAKNDNPLDRQYSKEGFDMQTAEGYEAYLKSL